MIELGGLTMGAASIVAGAGYALTPAAGPDRPRFGAFGDPWVEPAAAAGGLLGGLALIAVTIWLVRRLHAGRPAGTAGAVAAALTLGYVAAAKLALWISVRADPPLPPSWGWLRIPLSIGLAGAAAGLVGVLRWRRGRIPRV